MMASINPWRHHIKYAIRYSSHALRDFWKHCFERKFFHSPPRLTPIQLPTPVETHLWYVKPCEVRCESLLSKYWDVLSPCEKETVLRMREDELRKTALVSRVLVRTTIVRYQINSQVSPQSLKFRNNS